MAAAPLRSQYRGRVPLGSRSLGHENRSCHDVGCLLESQSGKSRFARGCDFLRGSRRGGRGDFGSRYLVDEHAGLFKDVKYAFGEFGGFNLSMGGKRIYPIMVAEKQCCWMKITFHGRGGHGSMPVHHQAMAKLART